MNLNSMTSMKLMMCYLITTLDLIMMNFPINNTLIQMLIKLLNDSTVSMELKMKMKENSLTSTIQIEREHHMKFLVLLEMLLNKKLMKLIESLPSKTIPRTIKIVLRQDRGLIKSMKLIIISEMTLEDITMTLCHSVKLLHSELTIFSKTFGVTGGINLNKLMNFSDQCLEINGVEIWIELWIKGGMKIGVM